MNWQIIGVVQSVQFRFSSVHFHGIAHAFRLPL